MILSLAILLLLIIGWHHGWCHGLITEIMYVVGYIILLIIAKTYYQTFGNIISNIMSTFVHQNGTMFNRGMHVLAFLLIFGIGSWLLRLIIRLINKFAKIPLIKQINELTGAAVGVLLVYIIIVIILNLVLLFPHGWLFNQYQHSTLAQMMVNNTPFFTSNWFVQWLQPK